MLDVLKGSILVRAILCVVHTLEMPIDAVCLKNLLVQFIEVGEVVLSTIFAVNM